jgi:hypothetical protein
MGPEFIIHHKYSNILNVTFVTMMYGVGIPILFPIACLNFTIMWLLERYHLAYTFQIPPTFDDKLTKNAVNILKIAPLLFMFMGFWMLSS